MTGPCSSNDDACGTGRFAGGVREAVGRAGLGACLVALAAGAMAAEISAAPPPGIAPRLAAAAERTLDANPALSAARSGIRASGHDIRAAKWLRYPSVAVQAVTRTDRVGVSPNVQVFQPVWAGGRISGSIDRATALKAVAQAQYQETAFDLLLRLSDAFHDIAKNERLITVYTDSLMEHRRLVESMERRVAQEVSPRSDLDLARSRLAQVEQELTSAAAQHDASLRRLTEIVGVPDFEVGAPPVYAAALHHPATDGAVDRALACNPTVARLAAEVQVAEADRRLSRSATLPQLGVQYSYDRFAGNQLGLAVKMESNGGLSSLALADAAAARRQASEYRVAAARREVQEAVGLDIVENRSSRTRMASTVAAAESTARVTESLLRQFVAGRRTWLDVMNAVREGVAAKAALVQVESSAMASAARLQLRTCAWAPEAPEQRP
jgi:adhesin transport system outer membrane protein